MNELNLPPYDASIGGTPEHPTIFDILRRRHIALTPEEWVRQHFIHHLINNKGYPRELLANEVKLQIGEKTLRADSILYTRELRPRMVIEYKAPSVAITKKVFEQVTSYNLLLHVDYIIVSNGLSHYCCKMDYDNKKCLLLPEIPDYKNL